MNICPISVADISFRGAAGVDMPDAASWSYQDKRKVALLQAPLPPDKNKYI